jgi:hypothetical protein
MTNIKNFEIVKATLLEKKEAIQKQIDALCDESKGEVTELFKEVFAEQLASYADVELKANNNAVAFRIKRKDICNITLVAILIEQVTTSILMQLVLKMSLSISE